MSPPTLTPDDLDRLERERAEADRTYNDALTALDRAIVRAVPEIPHPPPPYDEHQITPLNQLWQLVAGDSPPLGTGWRARLRGFVWRFVGPLFQQQQQFNAALVDHVNRNVAMARQTTQAIESLTALLADQLAALVTFESRLVQWAQQITPYVDTKDRVGDGRLQFALTTGLDAMADELRKRADSMIARERRYEARVEEVRTALAVVQQATQTLKRELARLVAAAEARTTGPGVAVTLAGRSEEPVPGGARPERSGAGGGRGPAGATPGGGPPDLDAYKYAVFEDKFRGSSEEIRARLAEYVADFEDASDVLDLGCGRGEFLDLLRERGIAARGVDVNHEMVERCRARGLEVVEADALAYLDSLPDSSLGGLFAAQVVEHLEPGYLVRLLETAYYKLRPGSKIVLETINPTCWYAFFESFLRDLTHVRPLHPDTLVYLLVASGFQRPEVRYLAPFPEASKLQPVPLPRTPAASSGDPNVAAAADLAALVAVVNENMRKLNSLLFTSLDYAVVAIRG